MGSFAILFSLGILFQHFLYLPILLIPLIVVFLTIVVWNPNQKTDILLLLCMLVLLCGMFRVSLTQEKVRQIESITSSFHNSEVLISGLITDEKKVKNGLRIKIEIDQIKNENYSWDGYGKLHLYVEDRFNYEKGSTIQVDGIFSEIKGPRNPGDFDFKSFYQKQNVWGNIYTNKNSTIKLLSTGSQSQLNEWLNNLRNSMSELFMNHVGGDASKLVTALIVGLREGVPKEIKQDFADTGVIHVLAVSGLHVGYVLIIVTFLVGLIKLPFEWKKILVVLILIFYAVLTGGKPSVWRATLMASLYVLAPLVNRDVNLWNIIGVSALGLLIYKPVYLFDLGFLLSFTAVMSIVFFMDLIQKIVPEKFQFKNISNKPVKYTWGLFLVSLSAQIGTLPFIMFYFDRIPVISLIANVIIVPLIAFIVGSGFAILLLGSWIPFTGWIIGNFAWGLSNIVFFLTHTFAQLPISFVEVSSISLLNLIQYVLVVSTLFLFCRKMTWKKGVLSLLLLINSVIWSLTLEKREIDVIFLDVGQGDAAIVRIPNQTKNDFVILIDAGMKNFRIDYGEKVVVPVLKHLGVDEIDLIVMSHPHSDHIGGISSVISQFPVKEIWDSHSEYNSKLVQNLKAKIDGNEILYTIVDEGVIRSEDSHTQLIVFHPDSIFCSVENNVNNESIVFKLNYGDASILFSGDLEEEGDEYILHYKDLLESDILKVGHHGSITSSTLPFLNAVDPQIAVISVGERNKFGHPSGIVLDRLNSLDIEIHRTDMEGAVWFKSDGKNIWKYDWR
tara:strand:- start:187 stop:2538 length:2352 start_codon:yes stop_codon:yes gene_type:complete